MSYPRKKRRHPKGSHRPMPMKPDHALPGLVNAILHADDVEASEPPQPVASTPPAIPLDKVPDRIVQALIVVCGLIAVLTFLKGIGA